MKIITLILIVIWPSSSLSDEIFSWSATEDPTLEVGLRAKTVTVWETTTLFVQYAYKNVSNEICYVPVKCEGANLWVEGTGCLASFVPRPHPDQFSSTPRPYAILPSRIHSDIQPKVAPTTVFPIPPGETLELSPFGVCIEDPSALLRVELSVDLQRSSDPFAYNEDLQKHLAKSIISRVFKTPSQSYRSIETGTGDEKPLDLKKIISPDWKAAVTVNFEDQEKDKLDAPTQAPTPKVKKEKKSK